MGERNSYTFSTKDERVNQFMEDVPNNSSFLEALVQKQIAKERERMDDLNTEQREGLQWIENRQREYGKVRLETAKNKLSQKTNKSEELVVPDILRVLESKNYIEIRPGMQSVWIAVTEKTAMDMVTKR